MGVWALIADGPLAPIRMIGLSVHRRGLLLVAVAVAVVPFATGQAHNLEVLLPCLGAAAVLLRLALIRIASPPVPDTLTPPGAPSSALPESPSSPAAITAPVPAPAAKAIIGGPPPRTAGRPSAAGVARVSGRLAGRAGSMAAQKADVAVPRGARAAGRLVGRFRTRDHS